MELTNRFRVAVPVEEAWTLLTDVERIAPCLPGAQLTEVDFGQFATSLEAELAASPILPAARPAATGNGSGSGPRAGAAPGAARRIDSAPAEPVDLLGAAGAPVLRRLVPLAAAVAAVWLLLRLARRR